MSKLYIRLNYKNACILKHALRDKIRTSEETKEIRESEIAKGKCVLDEEYYLNFLKELEEEKRALKAITDEIERCGFMHNTQILG
ncbi:hypothetical protein SDC9_176972 [bioreactor metagenome]|uniref:Uncharacterized protein n=1 Tax=bioreactor metagenome TaxID=1076179 RepID=A0A645GUT5_9ZZZZ